MQKSRGPLWMLPSSWPVSHSSSSLSIVASNMDPTLFFLREAPFPSLPTYFVPWNLSTLLGANEASYPRVWKLWRKWVLRVGKLVGAQVYVKPSLVGVCSWFAYKFPKKQAFFTKARITVIFLEMAHLVLHVHSFCSHGLDFVPFQNNNPGLSVVVCCL